MVKVSNTGIIRFLGDFTPLLAATFGVMIISRCYEWGLLIYQHGLHTLEWMYLGIGLLEDVQISIVGAVFLWGIFTGIKKTINKDWAVGCISALITALGLANILLITYFSATLIPLGPEFWAYSTAEMVDTVIASKWLTTWGILALVILGYSLFRGTSTVLLRTLEKISPKIRRSLAIVAVVGIFSFIWNPVNHSNHTSNYQVNKIAYFVSESIAVGNFWGNQQATRPNNIDKEFPFLRAANDQDVLSPFLKNSSSPPNIVFLIVESLGGEFVRNSSQWGGFAPYLDSLSRQALYWENGLSLSGRTFGVVPSLLGSLPPGNHGFMDLGPDYPNHNTLIRLLGDRGYHTAFYSGYNTYFDDLDYFLDYQGIDFVLNKQLIEQHYKHKSSGKEQNYWGFDDKTMFDIASAISDTIAPSPRLEIYHTLQSHSPFTVPNPEQYEQRFQRRLHKIAAPASQKEAYRHYKSELITLLYADDAVRNFMNDYRKRPEYQNTIFVITGDHWLIPVPQTSQISRYHVPIIIYSPLLKNSVRFKSVNTHANIVPTLTTHLKKNYDLSLPDSVHWIGAPLDTARVFRNIHSLPLMKNKNQLTDFLNEDYYLAGNQLYKLNENLQLIPAESSKVKNGLQNRFSRFKVHNQYVVSNDKLYPYATDPEVSDDTHFIVKYDTLFQRIDSKNLSPDEQFQLARQWAFDGNYEISRAIAKRLLQRHPEYHDVRVLMGRTYAWEGRYEKARAAYRNVLQQDPTYYDTYNAFCDTERWAKNYQSALEIINQGLKHHPDREEFLEKKIRILVQLNQHAKATSFFEKLKEKYPDNSDLPELQKYTSE